MTLIKQYNSLQLFFLIGFHPPDFRKSPHTFRPWTGRENIELRGAVLVLLKHVVVLDLQPVAQKAKLNFRHLWAEKRILLRSESVYLPCHQRLWPKQVSHKPMPQVLYY